jgi:lysophospholipase L1-like esterase
VADTLVLLPGASAAETTCRLGVLAFGDSITNGGGELQWGVALQSWALWVARGLGMPFTSYAVDGARAEDVVARQISAFEQCSAEPDAGYEVGCLYIGVNDVRSPSWSQPRFAAAYAAALEFLTARCRRTLALTAPLDLGRPRVGAKVLELNATIERLAGVHCAILVDLRDFGARNQVMTDHVHPTAFGQIAIAERALRALERDGLSARVSPASLISYETTRWTRLRGDATYVYRHAKVSARSLTTRLAARALASRPHP